MLNVALMSALAYFICYAGNWIFGQSMSDRPIVVGAVTGLFLGQLREGIMIGAALEAVFMGSVNIGGQVSADYTAATVFAIAFSSGTALDGDAALSLSIPIGVLMGYVTMFVNNVFLTVFAPLMDKWASEGNEKGLLIYLNFGVWLVKNIFFTSVVFAGIFVGYNAVEAFVNSIPDVLMTGLTVTGQLLPAVGLALLMKMIWAKEIAPYYLLGFILYIYVGLPIVAVAALGIIATVIVGYREFDLNKIAQARVVSSEGMTDEEELEDFLK